MSKDYEDMTNEELMKEFDELWNYLTHGKDSSDDEVQALSRILGIERELTFRCDG